MGSRLESAELCAAWVATWLSLWECLLNSSTCLVKASLSRPEVRGEVVGLVSGLDYRAEEREGGGVQNQYLAVFPEPCSKDYVRNFVYVHWVMLAIHTVLQLTPGEVVVGVPAAACTR